MVGSVLSHTLAFRSIVTTVSVLPRGEVNVPVKVQIIASSCQGHGRCYDIAADLFGEDDEGYGTVAGDGTVPPGREGDARLAAANCPEQAIEMIGEA